MIEQGDEPYIPVSLEPMMDLAEFAHWGLDPGQHGLFWDFETKQYVVIVKNPRSVFTQLMGVARIALHSVGIVMLSGGLMQ